MFTSLFTFLTSAALASNQAISPEPELILRAPVRVTATCRKVWDRTAFDFDIHVSYGGRSVDLPTGLIGIGGGYKEALGILRRTIVWRQQYLFVRLECGGGNVWSCNTERVFAIRSDSLVDVGEFIVGEDRRPAESKRGSHFIDVYDKLEEARLPLSHVQRPQFRIALTDTRRGLTVDVARTWQLNREDYFALLHHLSDYERGGKEFNGGSAPALAAFAAPLAIAQYCRQTDEVHRILRHAAAALSQETVTDLEKIASMIVPTELPSHWRVSLRNKRAVPREDTNLSPNRPACVDHGLSPAPQLGRSMR